MVGTRRRKCDQKLKFAFRCCYLLYLGTSKRCLLIEDKLAVKDEFFNAVM